MAPRRRCRCRHRMIPSIWAHLRRGYRSRRYRTADYAEIGRLQRSPNAFRALMARSEPYLHYILNEIEKAGLPAELALLPAIESGFQAHVYSPNGAAGLWQFMPATGSMLGLSRIGGSTKGARSGESTRSAITYPVATQQAVFRRLAVDAGRLQCGCRDRRRHCAGEPAR